MFTTTPAPVSVSRVSGSMFERLSGYLFQRLPFFVTGDGLPMSCAHWSGTTGSTTIFVPVGDVGHHPVAGDVARVLARQDEARVQRVDEALPAEQDDGRGHERRAQRRRERPEPVGELDRGVGGEDAHEREDRHEPAAEVALLRAHEQEEQEDRRHEHPQQPALVEPQAHRAADGEDQRQPAQAPAEGPQVVGVARVLRQPELAGGVAGGLGLVRHALPEGGEVQQRVGVGDDERDQRADADDDDPAHRPRPPAGDELRDRGGDDRQQHDPARVLRRAGQAEPEAGPDVVPDPPVAQDARRAPQAEADAGQRRHVVERELGVEDRQEGDREDAGRQQPDAAVDEPRAGEVQQPDGDRAAAPRRSCAR